jgi:hypothetical protein
VRPLAALAHPCSVRRALFRHIDRIEALLAQSLALDQPSLGRGEAVSVRRVRVAGCARPVAVEITAKHSRRPAIVPGVSHAAVA